MHIGELSGGTNVSIEASADGKMLRFNSYVLNLSDTDMEYLEANIGLNVIKCVSVIQLITYQDIPINFISDKVELKVLCCSEVGIRVWQNVKVVRYTLPDLGNVHVCMCAGKAHKHNRRSEYRLSYMKSGTMMKDKHNGVQNIDLRDISEHGIGLLAKKDCGINVGDLITVQFRDGDFDKESETLKYSLYTMEVNVVRVVPTKTDKVVIGGVINVAKPSVSNLIFTKQRERMRVGK